MKLFKLLCFVALLVVLAAPLVSAPADVSGTWLGTLEAQGMKLRIVFKVDAKTDGTLAATLSSPDQGPGTYPCSSVKWEQNRLTIEIEKLTVVCSGEMQDAGATWKATFSQGGQSFPLVFKRVKDDDAALAASVPKARPQDPQKPYPYREEDVVCRNALAGFDLAGTLTLPQGAGPFPAVVLITGSGAQDRNEEIFNHRPFLVLADYLTRRGIAVLRLDDRGVGKSGGKDLAAVSTTLDFVGDIAAAVAFLRTRGDIAQDKIGLCGHSEGGCIGPMLAAQDKGIAFVVMMAGLGTSGVECLLAQEARGMELEGTPAAEIKLLTEVNADMYKAVNAEPDNEKALQKMRAIFAAVKPKLSEKTRAEAESGMSGVAVMTKPWFRYFLKYDPAPYLQKVACPVLVLNGGKDCQVIATDNLPAVEKWLKKGGNTRYTVKLFPEMNHLFQSCKTGAVSEYLQIDETVAPIVLQTIGDWITGLYKK
jgi:uncharacterized protein